MTQRVPAGLKEVESGDQSTTGSCSRGGEDSTSVGQKRRLKKLPVKEDSLASFIHRSREGIFTLLPVSTSENKLCSLLFAIHSLFLPSLNCVI